MVVLADESDFVFPFEPTAQTGFPSAVEGDEFSIRPISADLWRTYSGASLRGVRVVNEDSTRRIQEFSDTWAEQQFPVL